MRPLVIIPARGGSKGLPGKNIKSLNGQPLIAYTINAARKVFDDDQIIVSTDDAEIKSEVESMGLTVPFLRPSELATDTASTRDVLLHAVSWYEQYSGEVDFIVLLQPTSPLRTSKHIREAVEMFKDEIDMVVSVKETASNPYYVLFEENEEGYLKKVKESKATRRQDVPKVWEYNGAIYVISKKSIVMKEMSQFDRVRKYEMETKASIDIDDQFDFMLCEFLLRNISE